MPRPKRNAAKPTYDDEFGTDESNEAEESDEDSDFEDPDEIEVPGGGRSLKNLNEDDDDSSSLLPTGNGSPSTSAGPPQASTSGAPYITKNMINNSGLKGVPAGLMRSQLKQNQPNNPNSLLKAKLPLVVYPDHINPPLIDLSDDDNGLEILKEIPGNSSRGFGGGASGLSMGAFGGLLSSRGFNPYMSPSLLAAQDPTSGVRNNPTDLLQKSIQNGGLAQMLSSQGPFFGGLGGMGRMPANPYTGGGMYTGSLPASALLQSKQISSLWMQGNPNFQMASKEEDDEGAHEDEDDMGVIETYSNYMPTKLKIGRPHPDPVVETASMASVEPPEVWYELSLPDDVIDEGKLSALQLETVVYSCQQHSQILEDGNRAGFLVGDGAGVGKGRTIAGIIYENYEKGRKRSIWVSVSNDLKYDAERDLRDIGASHIDVHFLSKMKYAKINSSINNHVNKGVLYATYSALIGESQAGGKYKSRLKQILNWCGEDFDGCIVFDECHRAKNLCPSGAGKPTKTGQTVLALQEALPKARIVYASATGASEPKHMAYMVRLGIWGLGSPFRNFTDFLGAVEKRGVGAMEIVAMDMKLRGMYIARQLSFQGVGFRIDEVELSNSFRRIYDKSVDLWVDLLHKFEEAAVLIDADKKMRKTMWGQFWSSHQRFFKYLCIASKVQHVINVSSEMLKMGKCVVIGLQSTGEARTMEVVEREEELTDFVSTAKGVLQSLVEKHFPAPDRDRINRILGIGKPKSFLEELNVKPTSSLGAALAAEESNGKRKKRQVSQKKKMKFDNSGLYSDENDNGSDFELSDNDNLEDEDENFEDEDVDEDEDDFNPFGSGSDDEEDPWSKQRKKKAKKRKAVAPKKPVIDPFAHVFKGKKEENGSFQPPPPKNNVDRACQMKEEILRRIEKLGNELPANTLDQLIDELGGPDYVSEMTGRKGRVVQSENGDVRYESRSEQDIPLETLNLTEKDRFMRGDKNVAIISEAASSGISLQADRRVKNQKRRVHLTLELPWSADRAIQQFGRTHRSNQVSAPEYILLISDLAGEHRFASIVAKRLESLGALTHGDRRATESRDLSRFNIDNKYGRSALEATFRAIMGYETPVVPPPADFKGDFFKDVADGLVGVGLITNSEDNPGMVVLEKGHNDMSKFLNRILGMKVDLQNALFQYFSDTLAAIISQAKRSGRYDQGILDVGLTQEDNVELVKTHTFETKHSTGKAKIELHVLMVERGLSWSDAKDKWGELETAEEGFYISHQVRNQKRTAILAVSVGSKLKRDSKKEKTFIVYRPNTGQQVKNETMTELKKKYKKVLPDEAEPHWNEQFNSSAKKCSHAYWKGNCKNVTMGMSCEIGLRRKTYNVLAGSVLSVWNKVEQVLTYDGNRRGAGSKMQVVRLKLRTDKRIVGTLIPGSAMSSLLKTLREGAEESEETIC